MGKPADARPPSTDAGERARVEPAWETLPADAALATLGSRRDGLTEAEAAERLRLAGPNQLPAARRRSPLRRFAEQFNNLLVLVLIGAAMVTAAIGHFLDTSVIVAVVVGNALIGFFQEGRAERALEAVGRLLAAKALAVRGGQRVALDAADLVPGDVVVLQSGDRVPADLRLIEAKGLTVAESILTGESVPVAKDAAPVAAGLPLGDRRPMAFSGTTVVSGFGLGVVAATGRRSEIGRIGDMVKDVEEVTTPLLERLSAVGRSLTIVILGFAAAIVAFGWFVDTLPFDELFLAAVGLAVAAIPEGLPAIVTIVLAIGVRRMAAAGALIRRLPAVETLGSITVICTDKTGTLTRNEMAARAVSLADGRLTVEGDGYAPQGRVLDAAGGAVTVDMHPVFGELARAAALCNDAALREGPEGWSVAGDPVDGALLSLALKAGIEQEALACDHPRLDMIPFESEHRYMATLHGHRDGPLAVVKGAPEWLIEICERERTAAGEQPIDREEWHRNLAALTADGMRVLGVAAARRPTELGLGRDTVAHNLVLLGLVGFIDPPRAEAIAAVGECRAAGITVKMITGDHAATALATAREVGIEVSGGVLTGTEIARLDDRALLENARRVNVFARVDPSHKLRLVSALQAGGEAVAMTGDGVNDAPALRRADIGVAMGRAGSDAAREAAEMVLSDDNFATIAHAVRVGRTIDDNLRKTLGYVLPTNVGEALVLVLAILTNSPLPITALQILWINFATGVTLAMAMAFEPGRPEAMLRRPRRRDNPLLDRRALIQIAFVSMVMAAATTWLFHFALGQGRTSAEARAVAVNVVVLAEIGYLLVIGTPWRRLPDGSILSNPIIGVAILACAAGQIALTQWPTAAGIFGMAPLGWTEWGWIGASGVVLYAAFLASEWLLGRLSRPSG